MNSKNMHGEKIKNAILPWGSKGHHGQTKCVNTAPHGTVTESQFTVTAGNNPSEWSIQEALILQSLSQPWPLVMKNYLMAPAPLSRKFQVHRMHIMRVSFRTIPQNLQWITVYWVIYVIQKTLFHRWHELLNQNSHPKICLMLLGEFRYTRMFWN